MLDSQYTHSKVHLAGTDIRRRRSLGPCFQCAFMGTITEFGDNELCVETALGTLRLSINRWTKVYELGDKADGKDPPNKTGSGVIRQDCIHQLVMGRLISYREKILNQAERSLCTELCLQGHQHGNASFLSPGFWIRELKRTADWWLERAIDTNKGGYFTDITQDGYPSYGVDNTDKWPYVVSRTLYAFSTAFSLTGERRFLEASIIGNRFLMREGMFEQSGHTLFHTRLDHRGQRHPDDPEFVNIFTQIYTLTGLITYYDVSRCPQTQLLIDANLRALSELYNDSKFGGYFDAISRSDLKPVPGITDSKSFNSIVDPLSATLFFLQNVNFHSKHFNCRLVIRELCGQILRYMVDPEHNFIREIFNRSWQCQAPKWRNPYNTDFYAGNIGGNLKVVWVLLRALEDLTPELESVAHTQVNRIYNNLLQCGAWDALRGGWFEVMSRESPAGLPADHMWDSNKVWWQQEEGVMASFLLHIVDREESHLEMARDCLRFWLTYFMDWSNGGVFDTVSIDGWPINGLPLNRQKGSWLKGGYHETELARFVHIYLKVLQDEPVTLYYAYDHTKEPVKYRTVPARIPGLTWHVIEEKVLGKDLLKVEYGHRWQTEVGS
jgi:mannose/cellobiose epimerase-like protein (N-acyl-D-glucosamine 2-epimerase family)